MFLPVLPVSCFFSAPAAGRLPVCLSLCLSASNCSRSADSLHQLVFTVASLSDSPHTRPGAEDRCISSVSHVSSLSLTLPHSSASSSLQSVINRVHDIPPNILQSAFITRSSCCCTSPTVRSPCLLPLPSASTSPVSHTDSNKFRVHPLRSSGNRIRCLCVTW